jgi:hypothetical protein
MFFLGKEIVDVFWWIVECDDGFLASIVGGIVRDGQKMESN